ncbi:MAG TPA: glycosyl hydrolase family 28-related protein [Bacteroidota bacterium]|nr:glycosyl hydrolase family 28-related protein [Bacteroidota bacterium]
MICSTPVIAQPAGGLNVVEYGARADATTDNTRAFQKALDAAQQQGGIVFVPAGTYRVAGPLNVPQCVTLRGAWDAPHSEKGSAIYATGGAGDENGPPLITLNPNSCVEGLTIFYPEQDADRLTPYPWTIQGRGIHCSVIDVTLVNPYKGIDFGTYQNQLHYIRNVYACPLKVGIFVDKTTDIGRIENVHLTPGAWDNAAAYPNAPTGEKMERLVSWLHQNLVGYLIGRTDWEYMNNCFVIFPKIGFHFVETDSAADTGLPNAELTQCGSDICEIAVQVDASQEHAGITFLNSQFMAQAIVGPTNKGPVKFSNCGFWARGATASQSVIEGSGTVTFTACHFASWARKPGAEEAACILVKGGSVIVNGCEFFADRGKRHDIHELGDGGKRQIELGPGTQSAAIFGNRFRGGETIVNNASPGASIQIGLNVH